jgi:hypothetical protein
MDPKTRVRAGTRAIPAALISAHMARDLKQGHSPPTPAPDDGEEERKRSEERDRLKNLAAQCQEWNFLTASERYQRLFLRDQKDKNDRMIEARRLDFERRDRARWAEEAPIRAREAEAAGRVSELLFTALMKQVGIETPNTKFEGLSEFQKRGWALVDATYEQLNKHDKRGRDLVIDRDYPVLCGDLKRLLATRWSEVPLVLIKANVCRLLGARLEKDGFNVLNKGRGVYFPGFGRQLDFDRQFREIVPQNPLPLTPDTAPQK